MSKCLICDEITVELLNIPNYPYSCKNENNVIYYNKCVELQFNYCLQCYHSQVNHYGNEDDNLDIELTIPYKSDSEYIKLNNIKNKDIMIINDETIQKLIYMDEDYDYCDVQCKKIIFYKSFDKTPHIIRLLNNCKKILDKNGEIMIYTSCDDVIKDKKYDTISTNIISFFSTNSMKTLCEKVNMVINNIEKLDNCTIYYIGFKSSDIGSSNDLIKNLYIDIENELYNDKSYLMFNLKGLLLKNNIQKYLLKLNIERLENNQSKLILGYGLFERSINLINFCELSDNYLDYFLSFDYSNVNIPGTMIQIKNYWDLLSNMDFNSKSYSNVTIINFDHNRINDSTLKLFKNLYGCNIKIIDII